MRQKEITNDDDYLNKSCFNNGDLKLEKMGIDDIIVGAGATLTHTLGKDGHRVHAIERDLTEVDRIVIELLQPGGYLKLIVLGIEDCVDEIDSQRVLGYALFKDGKNAKLSYPWEKFVFDVSGRIFHNGHFIQRIVWLEQGTVTYLLEENGTIKGVQYKNKAGEEIKAYAPLTIVDIPSCFVGLILENCELPFPSHGHVIGDPSPILFYPINSTEAPPHFYDSFIATIDKGRIRIMQNRSMSADPHPIPGALLMGDAFNMHHPLIGGCMTVALSDIVVGAQTDTELKEKKLRIEDTLNATKVVAKEGIVVGGGYTLLRLAAKVHAVKLTLDNDEQKVETYIVKRPLSYPRKLIAKNASDSGSVVMEKVLSSDNFKYGYNATTGKYEDLMTTGIIDPTKIYWGFQKISSHDDKVL
ncbi:hypothetical protein GIB67_015713 [Kingdonia uniflora]|uniref:Squalene monooxygenase n=1 Tax=Kingdonia uniflora TaxID=39325 RepID=A0A7J7NUA6_9MAGN|nr:hypothetical protein GIB67_015713 [Kingdonia uniflora]